MGREVPTFKADKIPSRSPFALQCSQFDGYSAVITCTNSFEPLFPVGTEGDFGAGFLYNGTTCNPETEPIVTAMVLSEEKCVSLDPFGFPIWAKTNCSLSTVAGTITPYADPNCTTLVPGLNEFVLNATCIPLQPLFYGAIQGSCLTVTSNETSSITPTATPTATTSSARSTTTSSGTVSTTSRPGSASRKEVGTVVAFVMAVVVAVILG